VFFTYGADADLDDIFDYIAQDSVENVLGFLEQLQIRINPDIS
jgi:plasmid stabilization system protein ParE